MAPVVLLKHVGKAAAFLHPTDFERSILFDMHDFPRSFLQVDANLLTGGVRGGP